MSSPDTNLPKQRERHAGPIIGISLALTAAAALFIYFLATQADGDADDASLIAPASTAADQ